MQINDIFTDLHGNQYEIMDFHVLGPDYPLFQDNRDAILTSSTQDEHINLIIRGNDQLVIYNEHHKVYWMYDIKFIQHFDKFDIRKGFYNEKNTKGNRSNRNDGRISSNSKSRNKRR